MDKRQTALLSACILLALASPLLGNGVIRDGVGAISASRGGTNIAHFDNGSILLDNPAGMVNICGCGLTDFGVDMLITDIDYEDPDNPFGVGGEDKAFPLSQLSYIEKGWDGDIAYGLGVFVPAGFGAEYDMISPAPFSDTRRYKSLGALVKVLPGAAIRLTERLSIGGTLGVGVSHVELEGPFFLQSPGPFLGTPTILDLQATGATLSWSAGLQYELGPYTMLGVAYQSENDFDLNGNAAVTVPGLGDSRFDADVDITWPQSVGVGLVHYLCAHRRISLDVLWFDWSEAFDQLDLRLSGATNPLFSAVLGPSVTDSFPLDWKDGVSVRTGYEHFLTDTSVVRLGYVYNSETIPLATLTPFIPAILEHSVSAGYGWQWGEYHVDMAYQVGFGPISEVETSRVVGGDFDFSRIQAQAHWMYLGISRHF